MDYARFSVFDSHGKDGTMWIGFDLDGTVAEKVGAWKGIEHIGKPIKGMVEKAKKIHAGGKVVKVFTARVADKDDAEEAKKYIRAWCKEHLGFVPEITHEKDALAYRIYDDRAFQVIPNTGVTVQSVFFDAMKIISKLTDGFRNCQGLQAEIGRLVELRKTLESVE